MSIKFLKIPYDFDPETGELRNEKELLSTGIVSRRTIEFAKRAFAKIPPHKRKKWGVSKPTYNGVPISYKDARKVLLSEVKEKTKKVFEGIPKEKTIGATSLAKAVAGGKASPEEIERRERICKACQEVDEKGERLYREIKGKVYCGEPRLRRILRSERESGCGCRLRWKWHFKGAACPHGKW